MSGLWQKVDGCDSHRYYGESWANDGYLKPKSSHKEADHNDDEYAFVSKIESRVYTNNI